MGARVLVVNDTQEILELFREMLEEEGYGVVLYSYSIMDMDEIEHIKPDAIVLDYIIGGEKGGWQMLQKLMMRRSTAMILVIVCTAATREVREIKGYLRTQGIALVPQPFDIDTLLDAIKRGLGDTSTTAEHIRQRKGSEQAKGHE